MTDDALLTKPDRQEAFSRAYVHAIAAGTGYVVASMDFDRDGIDVEIKAGGQMRPSLGLQLKATINLGQAMDGVFRFPLKRRNYDLLRLPVQFPRILVVLDLPNVDDQWLIVSPAELVLRRSAYWVSLAGSPETTNSDSVTVSVPEKNLLDVNGLRVLMEQSRKGAIA